jgi:riboflavin kinase/FMN adenylyltransferase
MEVVGPEDCRPPAEGSAVTVGAYDGIHLGHRALLADLVQAAAARGLVPAVVTFDRHPATVVRPDSAPPVLTDLDQKLELLASCGPARTLVVPFDRARADETAEDFVAEILVGCLGARLVVVGEDFHFGHGRKGDVALLTELGREAGFEVAGVRLSETGGAAISSTRIRQLLAQGDVAGAAALLGRPHEVRGPVVHGDGRGGPELGYPTANLALPPGLALPAVGVYAGRLGRTDGSTHPAAISVGLRPTFYPDGPEGPRTGPLVEAHLLDFEGDLYGEAVRLQFVAHLRPERRFDSVADLVAEMDRDVARTRALLAPPGGA